VLPPLSPIDWTGLALWALLWCAYSIWSMRPRDARHSLNAATARYRRGWMREAYRRENRMVDVGLVGSLMQSATFFSSTTLLVLGGLFAVLGTPDKASEVVAHLPLAGRSTQRLFETKALVVTLVFVYAFFRFTWSLRQFNLVSILLGAFPARPAGAAADDPLVERASRLNELAGTHFAQGLRAYYFAVPLLLWLMNAWLLIAGSVIITLATYYMDFRSATVTALTDDATAPPTAQS
jgi:uncharacterized membrane protein